MSAPAIVLSAPAGFEDALAAAAAGCEEEGVPSIAIEGTGTAAEHAREAARASGLGIGVGIGSEGACIALAASAGPYLAGGLAETRLIGQNAARIAARRPLSLDRLSVPGPARAVPPSPPSRGR